MAKEIVRSDLAMEQLLRNKAKLLSTLKTIKGTGSFVASGTKDFKFPGLNIKGIGEIGFPLNPLLAKEIIKVAHKAPFGKGSLTITDTTVRSAWEIDADQLAFKYEGWDDFVQDIINDVTAGLGIESKSVSAALYKMLLYETGDFFLPHKDSEKEPGMFGTLVIGLPSPHTGGALHVRFDGREEAIDFSVPASNYRIPYVAFYADCDHEIKPLTSGYRACIVYNLVISKKTKTLSGPQFSAQSNEMAQILKSLENSTEGEPTVVMLGHQYTPANFSLGDLKLHDKPRAEALLAAAEKAGYFARLGLVTHYLMGDLEGGDSYDDYYGSRSRSRRYAEPEPESMGEIYESDTTISHWSHDTGPSLGEIDVEEDDLVTDIELGIGEDPIEQESEGFTGNAGMTIQYWYHYGAVVLWPKSQHAAILSGCSLSVRLEWLGFYGQNWDDSGLMSPQYGREILEDLQSETLEMRQYESLDFSAVADVLSKLKDEKLLKSSADLLAMVFRQVSVSSWKNVLEQYSPALFEPIFAKAADTEDIWVINRLLEVLVELDLAHLGASELDGFLMGQIPRLPKYFEKLAFSKPILPYEYIIDKGARNKTIMAIFEKTLQLSQHKNGDANWIKQMVTVTTRSLTRKFVNKVLSPVLLQKKHQNNVLAKEWCSICTREVYERTVVKPLPPSNWTRELPESERYDRSYLNEIKAFLASPTERVFDYRQKESLRNSMENAIKSVRIDLSMETIKKGSPYTLRLTKTQASYERALKHWHEDVGLLAELRTLQ